MLVTDKPVEFDNEDELFNYVIDKFKRNKYYFKFKSNDYNELDNIPDDEYNNKLLQLIEKWQG
jgi:hypothetical protein